jgi:hypothetical protein
LTLQEKRFRNVSTANAAFRTRLAPFPPAVEVLRKIGFREDTNTSSLVLTHANPAPLMAADQVRSWEERGVDEIIIAVEDVHHVRSSGSSSLSLSRWRRWCGDLPRFKPRSCPPRLSRGF